MRLNQAACLLPKAWSDSDPSLESGQWGDQVVWETLTMRKGKADLSDLEGHALNVADSQGGRSLSPGSLLGGEHPLIRSALQHLSASPECSAGAHSF